MKSRRKERRAVGHKRRTSRSSRRMSARRRRTTKKHTGGAGRGQLTTGAKVYVDLSPPGESWANVDVGRRWKHGRLRVGRIVRLGGPVGKLQTYDVGFFDLPAHDAMSVPSNDEMLHRTGAPGEPKLLRSIPADRLMLFNEENKKRLIRTRRHNRVAVVRGAAKRAAVGRVLMNRGLAPGDQVPLRTPDDHRLHVALTGETHRRPAPGPAAGRHIPMSAPLTPKSRTRRNDIKAQRLQDAITRLDEAVGGGYAPYIRTAIANADRVKVPESSPSYAQAVQMLAQISQQTAAHAKAQEDKEYGLMRKTASE